MPYLDSATFAHINDAHRCCTWLLNPRIHGFDDPAGHSYELTGIPNAADQTWTATLTDLTSGKVVVARKE